VPRLSTMIVWPISQVQGYDARIGPILAWNVRAEDVKPEYFCTRSQTFTTLVRNGGVVNFNGGVVNFNFHPFGRGMRQA